MAIKKDTQAAQKKKMDKEWILLLPILFLVSVFLFGVRARAVPTHVADMFWYTGGEYAGDLYGYFRMQMFTVVTIAFGLYLAVCCFTGTVKVQKHKVYIPMAVYAVFVLLSYVFSEYKDIALFGYMSRYEGTVTLLCYIVITIYTMHTIRSEKSVKRVVRCFSVACLILGLWGVLQTMGIRMDMLPAWLYVPADLREMATLTENMHTTAVNWFFSNQNYTSFFMVFPISIFAMTCIAEEDRKKKVMYALLTGLLLFNLWQAASLGGMVGLAVAVVMAFIVAGMENILKWRKSLGLLVLAAIVSMGASMPVILKEVKSGSTEKAEFFGVEIAHAAKEDNNALRFAKIDEILTEGSDIVFVFEGKAVRIATENNKIKSVTDHTGAPLAADSDLMRVSADVDQETGYDLIHVQTANKKWTFAAVQNETYFIAPDGSGIKLGSVESIGFEENPEFATYRGYIWSKTLPLLKHTVLLGKGADTYAVYYPQTDFAGRYNIGYYNDARNIMIDKPHNLYLGTAVQTGVISMLALVVVYMMYLAESVKVYRKHTFAGFMDYIGLGICIAIAGFMVSALVNDGTVQMMPVVYVLLGMGFAINRLVKARKEQ